MKVVIYPNFRKQYAPEVTRAVCQALHQMGLEIGVDQIHRNALGDISYIDFGDLCEMAEQAEFAIAIGGDGTILKCARKLMRSDVKLLGINTGRLGFMAAPESDELDQLPRLLTGEYRVSQRMMLRAALWREGKEIGVYTALNDVYASRYGGRMSDFSVYADDSLIGRYRADGVVFSTPTGSTAYSLSAGGPIIEPDLSCIEMTLICPHSLFARPVLFSADRRITLVPEHYKTATLSLSADGNESVEMQPEDRVVLTRSSHTVSLVEMTDSHFFDSLNGKMMHALKE